MSVIASIYSTLAGKSVTVGSVTPTAYDLDELPNALESAHLPARLLTPMGSRGEGRDYGFIALGTTAKVTWHITDLLLWRSAAAGIGLQDIAPTLVAYAAAYVEMLRANRSMGQVQAHIVGARFIYGTFEWPEQSGVLFDGVACEVDIEELLSG